MSTIKTNCPVCGANLEITEVKTNNVKNNQLKTAEAKISALRSAGVNVSNLFSMRGADGGDAIARLVDGQLTIIDDNDPIFLAIINGGTIPNRRLFRRWVMAQMFRMLTMKNYRDKKPIGFTEALNLKGYKYSWEMVVEEFRVQARLFANDKENFLERNRWFNREVAVSMAEDYLEKLQKYVTGLPVRRCKKVPYIRLQGNNIFVDDMPNKVYKPLITAVNKIRKARTPKELWMAVESFASLARKTYMKWEIPQARAFKDAYKGAGAFYTLKNLIMFHGCTFQCMNGADSLQHLLDIAGDKSVEGYKLLGVLKDFLVTNNINIAAKMAEWRK